MKRGSIYGVSSAGRPAQAIMKLLYEGSKIYLDRKKALAEQIIPMQLPDRTMKPRRSLLDESVFDAITDRSAYWIGFLFNSYIGPPTEGQATIAIQVCKEEATHIDELKRFLGSTHNSEYVKNSVRFSVRSNRLVTALKTYGLVPGKKNRHVMHKLLHNRHFWRGLMDSNGCLSVCKMGRCTNVPVISLNGNRRLISDFIAYARSLFHTTKRPSKVKTAESWQVSFTFRQARLFVADLYRDGDFAIVHKQDLVNRMLE